MNPYYPAVALRADHRCEYCRAPEIIFNFRFDVEHIIPVARGGTNDDENLALACRAYNLYKAGHVTFPDAVTGAETSLFHPRRDSWNEHFRVDSRSGEIVGLTPAARATILRLRMNWLRQMEARRQWMRLGVFP